MSATSGTLLPPALLAALRQAPRRYRMPPLPADAQAARAEGPQVALAFAMERARLALERGAPPAGELRLLFTEALAALVREALAPATADPAFQGSVLRVQEPAVTAFVRLAGRERADQRALRSAVDAIAHPGKLASLPAGPLRTALADLHARASAADWKGVGAGAEQLRAAAHGDFALRVALAALAAHPALTRLQEVEVLRADPAVARYLALCGQAGPLAGSDAAAEQGRASGRAGREAERAAVEAFARMAALLDGAPAAGRCRALRGLRTPRGFPGAADKAKDEWDAALVRDVPAAAGADLLLLAEVKASPAAATPDYGRLLRGLQRLAHAQPDAAYVFPSEQGEVAIAGATLRALQPDGAALPAQVVYCCSAPVETRPAVLSAASRAVLLAEPASIAFASALAGGRAAKPLDAVWEALTTAPRLRSALHQYDTARRAREAMLHPDDLLQAMQQALQGTLAG